MHEGSLKIPLIHSARILGKAQKGCDRAEKLQKLSLGFQKETEMKLGEGEGLAEENLPSYDGVEFFAVQLNRFHLEEIGGEGEVPPHPLRAGDLRDPYGKGIVHIKHCALDLKGELPAQIGRIARCPKEISISLEGSVEDDPVGKDSHSAFFQRKTREGKAELG
jgi:hypothetical protein